MKWKGEQHGRGIRQTTPTASKPCGGGSGGVWAKGGQARSFARAAKFAPVPVLRSLYALALTHTFHQYRFGIAAEGLFDGLFEQAERGRPPFPASSRFGQAMRGVGDLFFSGRLSA